MRACDTVILWDTKPEPRVKLMQLGTDDKSFTYSGGGCWGRYRSASEGGRVRYLLAEFVSLTADYGLPAEMVHRAFWEIDEYRKALRSHPMREIV